MTRVAQESLLELLTESEQKGRIAQALLRIDIPVAEFVAVMQAVEAAGVLQLAAHPERRNEILRIYSLKRGTALLAVEATIIKKHERGTLFTLQMPDGSIFSHRHGVPDLGTWWVGDNKKEVAWPVPETPEQEDFEQAFVHLAARYTLGEDLMPTPAELVALLNRLEQIFFPLWRLEKDGKKQGLTVGLLRKWRFAILRLEAAKVAVKHEENLLIEVDGKQRLGNPKLYITYRLNSGAFITLRRSSDSYLWWVGDRKEEPPKPD